MWKYLIRSTQDPQTWLFLIDGTEKNSACISAQVLVLDMLTRGLENKLNTSTADNDSTC